MKKILNLLIIIALIASCNQNVNNEEIKKEIFKTEKAF